MSHSETLHHKIVVSSTKRLICIPRCSDPIIIFTDACNYNVPADFHRTYDDSDDSAVGGHDDGAR